MDDPFVGKVLGGRYRIVERIGIGGMGAVYAAEQEPLGRRVALKVLKQSLANDPVAMERFKREAQIIAQLGHPHIVGMHDFGVDGDVLYIAMEYLQGGSLAQAHRAAGSLPWGRSLLVMQQVTRALAAAHARGVIHRDLKPDNIVLVQAEGVRDFVKVLDFGIAKLMKEEEQPANLTGTGFVPGTPGYIAPEQVLGGGDEPRSDLYSLGVTWFEILAGRRPFVGDSAMRLFLAHLNQSPPSLREVSPGVDVPREIEDVIMGLLAKDPNARPESAAALLKTLDALAHDLRPTVSMPTQAAPGPGGVNPAELPTGFIALPPPTTQKNRALTSPSEPSAPVPVPASPPAPPSPSQSIAAAAECEPTSMTPMATSTQLPERTSSPSVASLAILGAVVIIAVFAARLIPVGDDPRSPPPAPTAPTATPMQAPPASSTPVDLGVHAAPPDRAAAPPTGARQTPMRSRPTPPTPLVSSSMPSSDAAPAPPVDADQAFLDAARKSLESCTDRCAQLLMPKLKTPAAQLDAKALAAVKDLVPGCVRMCTRPATTAP